MKGYKVFKSDWTCRGFKYEVGKTYKHDGKIKICNEGFHFCKKLSDCFNYYRFDSDNKVAEIEAIGKIEELGDKCVTDEITIVKEYTWHEVLDLINEGEGNSGRCNTGDRNTGNWNTGNRNTGDWNTGNRNTGNCNTGDCNTGNRNNGDCNTGDRNTGDWNTGNCNTGNWNTGDRNTGDWNTGNRNNGDCNTGDWNTGNRNTGNCNTGDWNTGNCNTGNWNTGDRNTGDWNTGNRNTGNRNNGDCNTGDRNTGDWNTGNCNTGDWNSTNYSTGFFNSEESRLIAFNRYTTMNRDEYDNLEGMNALRRNFHNNVWISSGYMTDEEKANNPEHETLGGYIKSIPFKDACKEMWEKMDEEEKQSVKDLPNFDAVVFYDITGIDVNKEVKNEIRDRN